MTPGSYYHVFNRANGSELLFREDTNYHFFLNRWQKYIGPIADTYAYCLMPNHFHFLVRIKEVGQQDLQQDLEGFENLEGLVEGLESLDHNRFQKHISKQFSNCFNSYSKAYNKMYKRMGSLFIPRFKRKEVISQSSIMRVIAYIHRNPVHHYYKYNPEDWCYSSYNAILSEESTLIKRKEVLDMFSGIAEFIKYHKEYIDKIQDENNEFEKY